MNFFPFFWSFLNSCFFSLLSSFGIEVIGEQSIAKMCILALLSCLLGVQDYEKFNLKILIFLIHLSTLSSSGEHVDGDWTMGIVVGEEWHEPRERANRIAQQSLQVCISTVSIFFLSINMKWLILIQLIRRDRCYSRIPFISVLLFFENLLLIKIIYFFKDKHHSCVRILTVLFMCDSVLLIKYTTRLFEMLYLNFTTIRTVITWLWFHSCSLLVSGRQRVALVRKWHELCRRTKHQKATINPIWRRPFPSKTFSPVHYDFPYRLIDWTTHNRDNTRCKVFDHYVPCSNPNHCFAEW